METYSDLVIQREVVEVAEGSMAVVGEERDGNQQAACEEGCDGWAIKEGLRTHQRSGGS